jgi:hypothetical protein
MAAQSGFLRGPQLRADPVGDAMDCSIPFRRGAGEEREHVLHLRHGFAICCNASVTDRGVIIVVHIWERCKAATAIRCLEADRGC